MSLQDLAEIPETDAPAVPVRPPGAGDRRLVRRPAVGWLLLRRLVRPGGVLRALGPGLPVVSLGLVVVGCAASPSLMPESQAVAIRNRERALASHAAEIQAAIRQSGTEGALAFLDAGDGRLVVLPGDGPADAWARYSASSESGSGRVTVPSVLTFVYRADVPKAPETVTRSALQQQQALRASVTALESELGSAQQHIEDRLGRVQRELAESIAATKQESAASLAATRAELQAALSALADDLATARKFMLQTAQLAWLNNELTLENASGIRKVATASQELSASSARLEEALHQLSESLAVQLKQLASRLDAIQSKVSDLK